MKLIVGVVCLVGVLACTFVLSPFFYDGTSKVLPPLTTSTSSTTPPPSSVTDEVSPRTGWSFALSPGCGACSGGSAWNVVVSNPLHSARRWARSGGGQRAKQCQQYLDASDGISVTHDRRGTNHALLDIRFAAASVGPDFFEGSVNVGGNTSQALAFAFHRATCTYWSQQLCLPSSFSPAPAAVVGDLSFVFVTHVHEGFRSLLEHTEGAHYDYSPFRRLPFGRLRASWPSLEYAPKEEIWLLKALNHVSPCVQSPRELRFFYNVSRWRAVGRDPVADYSRDPRFKGYFLSYAGFRHALPVAGSAAMSSMDLLGRMDWRTQYQLEGGACSQPPCLPHVLRDATIFFIGDSHMRIFFYGFLSRLGVSFPHNKVWRGDRTDVVKHLNLTVHFVASYFLNLSRPTAVSMLGASRHNARTVVVANLGQHHACHCWSISKHSGLLQASLRELLFDEQPPSTKQGPATVRQLVWLGVPAQPLNRHLYTPKPVGQSRHDCRNNQRHALYNAEQRAVLRAVAPSVPFLDAFSLSRGMEHTSLDGAHYYGWVREAWLDELTVHLSRYLS